MPLEITDTIEGLVSSNPTGTDSTTEGNDHMQLIKLVLKNIFPGEVGQGFAIPIVATEAELNFVSGVTSSIQDQIDQEVADRTTADAAIVVDYEAADATLQGNIDQEAIDREAADDALAVDIADEAVTRGGADIVLQNNIDQLAVDTDAAFEAVLVTTNALDVRVTSLEDAPNALPAGTRILFASENVPVGWSLVNDQNDRLLRVTSGVGNGTGGADSPSAPINTAHVHSTPDHTLVEAEVPAHTHTTQTRSTSQGVDGGSGTGTAPGLTGAASDSFGGGGSHSHGNTGSAGLSFQLQYYDVIIGVKD